MQNSHLWERSHQVPGNKMVAVASGGILFTAYHCCGMQAGNFKQALDPLQEPGALHYITLL
jgi:hypothetical protein